MDELEKNHKKVMTYIEKQDKKIVARCHFFVHKDYIYVGSMYIEYNKYKKKGFATKLLSRIKSLNKDVTLYVDVNNIPALSLYEKEGFKIIRKIGNEYYMKYEKER